MGWSHGVEGFKHVGYGVESVCEVGGCGVLIDRGMAFRCGSAPHSGSGCGAFVCDGHKFFGGTCQLCDPEGDESFSLGALRHKWE